METNDKVKMVRFSEVGFGDKFYSNKSEALVGKIHYIKIQTKKVGSDGSWVNAQGPISDVFFRYDSKVWINR